MTAALAALLVLITIGSICAAIIAVRPKTLMDMADIQLRRRQRLRPPGALPAPPRRAATATVCTLHTPLERSHSPAVHARRPAPAQPAANTADNVITLDQAAHIARVEQRIQVTAQAAAWDDHQHATHTPCPFVSAPSAASIWKAAYQAETQRIARIEHERAAASTHIADLRYASTNISPLC